MDLRTSTRQSDVHDDTLGSSTHLQAMEAVDYGQQ